jgi:hypothetical protein
MPGRLETWNGVSSPALVEATPWSSPMFLSIISHTRKSTIFGESFASTAVAINEFITRFKVGDRVLAVANPDLSHNTSKGNFQHYTVTLPPLCSRTSASSRAVICPLPYTLLVSGSLARATYALSYLTSQFAREIDLGKLLYDWEKIEVSPNLGRDGGADQTVNLGADRTVFGSLLYH